MTFRSTVWDKGSVKLPPYSGVRVMMMPYYIDDPWGSLPEYLAPWGGVLALMPPTCGDGTVGYLTIDEAFVKAGETHRRPGLHVDGVGPDGKVGGWGGGGGYAGTGMRVVASHTGCRAWDQEFEGAPGPNGDCSHLARQCNLENEILMEANRVYACGPLTVHASIPMQSDTYRQFCRISLPSNAPWYEGYTENPLGIKPTGPIHPARTEFMGYRP